MSKNKVPLLCLWCIAQSRYTYSARLSCSSSSWTLWILMKIVSSKKFTFWGSGIALEKYAVNTNWVLVVSVHCSDMHCWLVQVSQTCRVELRLLVTQTHLLIGWMMMMSCYHQNCQIVLILMYCHQKSQKSADWNSEWMWSHGFLIQKFWW